MAFKFICEAFGGTDQLKRVAFTPEEPTDTQVRLRVTSIGMNHADLMTRRGEYKLLSGDPPFTPGMEVGGMVETVGPDCKQLKLGDRVLVNMKASAPNGPSGGTYTTHYVVEESATLLAPDALPDEQLGAIWLAYMTAYGCLVTHHDIKEDDWLLCPAASSSVAMAAAQIAVSRGAKVVGLTRSEEKLAKLAEMQEAPYEKVLLSIDPDWWKEAKALTGGKGFNAIFDPIGAGPLLNTEILLLAQGGTLWLYGLLGKPDAVNLFPLLRKHASVRGYVNGMYDAVPGARERARTEILERLGSGEWKLPVACVLPLENAIEAQEQMERAGHIGKMILVP